MFVCVVLANDLFGERDYKAPTLEVLSILSELFFL